MPEAVRPLVYHVGIGVRDYEESLAFYRRVLGPLGVEVLKEVDADNRAAAFGVGGQDDFWIYEGRPVGRVHVAFQSPTRQAVDDFHAEALAAGARDNGAPGLRAERAADYYAAYVLDPNGNNIEAVWRAGEEGP